MVQGNRLYIVGGTDSQKPVLSIEWLDLDYLLLSPLEDTKNEMNEEESDEAPIWVHGGVLPTWHNGSSGLMPMGPEKMLAMSVYGTDHDKVFELSTRYVLRYLNLCLSHQNFRELHSKRILMPSNYNLHTDIPYQECRI